MEHADETIMYVKFSATSTEIALISLKGHEYTVRRDSLGIHVWTRDHFACSARHIYQEWRMIFQLVIFVVPSVCKYSKELET